MGVGRSGSTIFHKMFTEHPNLAWLSYLCDNFPDQPSILRFVMQAVDTPVLGGMIKNKFGPGEGYIFWERHCKGFSEPCRDLVAQDATNRIKAQIPKILSQILTKQRNRLLIKITGWPRVGFLHEIFNDAKFIHITRHPGAVINSLVNVRFWSGWRGPQNWRWGELTPDQMEEWRRFDRSFVALAGIELQILAEAMEQAKKTVHPNNFLEVRYEDLCESPVDKFKAVVGFCDLDWSPLFEKNLQKYSLKNTNYKWQQELTTHQQEIVEYFTNGYAKS